MRCEDCHYHEYGEGGIEVCRYDGEIINPDKPCHKDGEKDDKVCRPTSPAKRH